MYDFTKFFDLIQDSTYIENINKGIATQDTYFGAKAVSGMAYNKGPLYNNQSTLAADMTKPQSNWINSRS